MENFSPRGKYVVIESEPDKEQTPSGIFLPPVDHTFKDNFRFGLVRKVGTGRIAPETGERVPLELRPGDRVIYNDHSISHDTFHVLEERPRVVVCDEANVLAVVT